MVEIKSEILPALEQIEKLHKVSREDIIKLIETSVTNAALKFFGSEYKIISEMDLENVKVNTYILKKVVENVKDEKQEISLQEALNIEPNCKVGDEIKILVNNEKFFRIAAQLAKKIVVQKLRESYKRNVYEEYCSKIGELISSSVYMIKGKDIILDLDKAEGILPYREQVYKEKLKPGQQIKVLIKEVHQKKKGVAVIVSRFDKNFIKKLFESEIPEIKDKIIEIVNISRAPGYRTKIVLKSNNPKVDPVGSCVGIRGTRIKPIINELQGERIDLIPYTDNIEKFIAFSLSPWKVDKVEIVDAEKKIAKAYIPQKIYDAVADKTNINLNLAKEITGWEIKLEPSKEQQSDDKKDEKQE